MGQILSKWRVPLAAFFSLVLVVGAYLFARGIQSPLLAEASAETALLQAIATKDTDGDGLSDWEEALYGTSPSTVDTLNLGMTDGAAVAKGLIVPKAIANISAPPAAPATSTNVDYAAYGLTPPTPGTLTDAFAQTFFTKYLSMKQASGGADLSPDDIQSITQDTLDSLTSAITAAPDYLSKKDLIISGSGPDALRTFAAEAETILKKDEASTQKSMILYLQDAVERNDPTAPEHLTAMAAAFRVAAVGLAALSVPQELVESDLALINAMMRLSEISYDFSRITTDPLAAMLALDQYATVAPALAQAYSDLDTVYARSGVIIPDGAPGASVVNMTAYVAERIRAASQP